MLERKNDRIKKSTAEERKGKKPMTRKING